MRKTAEILLYLWQLPQNLLGLLLLAILGSGDCQDVGDCKAFFSTRMRGGISLGRYIIIREGLGTPDLLLHEAGHCRQSRILGPLYLALIGLPSLLWAAFYQYKPADPDGYYRFFTEKWADRLGGVRRTIAPAGGRPAGGGKHECG